MGIVETILEDSNSILGVYNIELKSFVYLNKKALYTLEVADIEDYTQKYPNGFRNKSLSKQQFDEIENHLQKQSVYTQKKQYLKNGMGLNFGASCKYLILHKKIRNFTL